jgi:NAD(P)-dependent dehydrogenase (short-subunit alcohol dehydrogenase family)
MDHWNGKTVLMTGGGSGIGKALSLAMAARGARVVVTDVHADSARAVAALAGPLATGHHLDVRSADDVRDRVEAIVRDHGRIDYLFNNAGIGVGGETHEISVEAWDRVIDVNIRGVVHGVAAAYPIMVKQRSGHIVNTASFAGLGPAPLLTPYAATKHAVVGLSTSLRIEGAAHGVRVTALCPAAIETPLLDAGNPADLPKLPWRPDIRRFLTNAAGPPYPVEKFAEEALAGIERNAALVVIPGRARLLWRVLRLSPWLAEKAGVDLVAAERATRT